MSDNFLGEIRLFPMGYAPYGWLPCEGQILQAAQNQALFALLGNRYGGNGTTNFQLPDFRGRVPLGGSFSTAGQYGGAETVTLTTTQMPVHTHQIFASADDADVPQPRANSSLASANGTSNMIYKNTSPNAVLAAASLSAAGGSQPHENRQPSLAVQFCIATNGIWPSRP